MATQFSKDKAFFHSAKLMIVSKIVHSESIGFSVLESFFGGEKLEIITKYITEKSPPRCSL